MKIPIPDDWQQEWRCVEIQWPDSPLWIALLQGFITFCQRGRYWDERTGSVIDAQAIGIEITRRNLPLISCAGTTEPETPYSPAQASIYHALDFLGCEDTEMPCIDISGLLKIEGGHLYARDACCEWIDIGSVGLASAIPGDFWEAEDPTPTYSACGKASALVDAIAAVIEAFWDAAVQAPWKWVGTVEAAVPGFNLSNTWITSGVLECAILTALGYSEADLRSADRIQTMKCQLVESFADDDASIPSTTYSTLVGIINSIWKTPKAVQWLQALAAIGEGSLDNLALLGATDTASDCACPGGAPEIPVGYDWAHQYDFRTGLHGWTDQDTMWASGFGLYNADVDQYDVLGEIYKAFSGISGGVVNYVNIRIPSWPTFPGDGGVDPLWFYQQGGEEWWDELWIGATELSRVLNWSYGGSGTLRVGKFQFTNAGVTGISRWDRLIITGTGDDPWPSDPGLD